MTNSISFEEWLKQVSELPKEAVCLSEIYLGTVCEIFGDEMAVVYEVPEGRTDQVYHKDQVGGSLIPEGTDITAFVILAKIPRPREPITESSFPDFRMVSDAAKPFEL